MSREVKHCQNTQGFWQYGRLINAEMRTAAAERVLGGKLVDRLLNNLKNSERRWIKQPLQPP